MSRNRKPRSSRRRRFRKFLIAIEIVGMLCSVLGAYVWGKTSQINTVALDESKIEVNEEVVAAQKMTGITNIALFGVDSRTGELGSGVNTDTIMIASINNDTGQINLCSLYRDTYIDVGGGTYRKANAAYSIGGPEGAISMLNKSMDLNLTNYITVDLTVLASIIDHLGGLDLEITAEEAYWTNGYIAETSKIAGVPQVNLPNENGGWYHMDGIQATSYCRIRYTAGDDFKRTERQRKVLSLIFEKAKTMDLETLNAIADDVFPKVQTNMTLADMLKIGASILTYNMNQSLGMPINKTTGTISGVGSSVIATDWVNDVSQLHELLFGEVGYTPSSTVQSMANTMQNPSMGSGSSYSDDDDYSSNDSEDYSYDDSEDDYYDETEYNNSDSYSDDSNADNADNYEDSNTGEYDTGE